MPQNQRINAGHSRVREGIAGAGVTADGATSRGNGFGGGIIDEIATVASILEGMIKSDPVASRVLTPLH